MKVIALLLIGLTLTSCARTPDISIDWHQFAGKWRDATIQEKKRMSNVFTIHEEFQSKDEQAVIAIFGPPSFKGENTFGEYEIKYDFDPVPETDGKIMQHLSFILEKGVVIRVQANILPE